MLLKVGAIMMLLSLGLSAVIFVSLRDDDGADQTLPVEPRAVEKTVEGKRKYDPGQKLEMDEEPAEEEPPRQEPPRQEPPRQEPPRQEPPQPKAQPVLPVAGTDWPRPTREELDLVEEPRHFAPDPGAEMFLTVEALGLYGVPVISTDELGDLDRGVVHVPETSFPWDGGAQRNVYLAGHYLGYPGTGSRLVFHELDRLRSGDEVFLEDRQGRVYRYQVSESFTAGPEDSWVMGQVRNRDMVTLQTCIPPTFEDRLII